MLPLNLSSDEGPIFVNAKQYHGIIRRRKCRAKAEMENKVKPRKVKVVWFGMQYYFYNLPLYDCITLVWFGF